MFIGTQEQVAEIIKENTKQTVQSLKEMNQAAI